MPRQLAFHQSLILVKYLLKQFGADSFKSLSIDMKNPTLEEIDNEGVTGFHKQMIRVLGDKLLISEIKLAEYDLNIVSHLRKINETRDSKISFKYFQYLSLLFVEYYLDHYFNHKETLLSQLNQILTRFNEENPSDPLEEYMESDLNKLALWNATGSGKTLLMHINYYQYLHYSNGEISEDGTFILLTPKESLSKQHLEEFGESNISANMYDKSKSRFFADKYQINILENTKLDIKDGDKKVAVSRFGNKNVVFVDEGHRGSSGDTWYLFRNELCEAGFSFEYSATFGQAIKASGKDELFQEYAKCIIFDYSYKYFHSDGYGKDYNILNIQDYSDNQMRDIYLTGCLLTYYQQKKLFLANTYEFERFNLENPLFVFVGSSVNAVRTENGRKVSDVVDILTFFKAFVTEEEVFKRYIDRIMRSRSGLIDSGGRNVFRNAFAYLTTEHRGSDYIYQDILRIVFNCSAPRATMHIENLKGVSGEIRVRVGENSPFGVINVGDDSKLLKLFTDNDFHTDSIDFNESLFNRIESKESTINILIGSKKFTEGWNSWRVSTMGLMNIGRSEGSEIIQLFGRGVRLKGHNMSLKRSSAYIKDQPEVIPVTHINILETLNIFGLRADYMKQFKEYLEAEEVPTDNEPPVILKLPVIRNNEYKSKGLYYLKVKDNLDFNKYGPKASLVYSDKIDSVVLDCYSKVQFQTSRNLSMDEITKNSTTFKSINLEFLDYDDIYFELIRYKNEKARYNINISRKGLISILRNNGWYKLLIPEEDYKRFQKIAITLLKKYFDKYYYALRKKWEEPLLQLVPMEDTNENFIEEEEYTIAVSNSSANEEIISFVNELSLRINIAKTEELLGEFDEIKGDLEFVSFSRNLYNPVLYLAKNSTEIGVSPVALNESEKTFIKDIKEYIENNGPKFVEKEIYIIRNKSKKGIGFFEERGFYPDFIMWMLSGEKQYITFIDPHGARNMSIRDGKVELHNRIKDIEHSLGNENVVLNSIIITPTKHSDLVEKHIPEEEWVRKNVIFMDNHEYMSMIFDKIE